MTNDLPGLRAAMVREVHAEIADEIGLALAQFALFLRRLSCAPLLVDPVARLAQRGPAVRCALRHHRAAEGMIDYALSRAELLRLWLRAEAGVDVPAKIDVNDDVSN